MSAKLAQIVAISTGVNAEATRVFTDVHHRVQRAELLTGMTRSYQPFNDDETEQLPGETKHVQVRATDALAEAQRAMTRMFDVTATKDRTNCEARADIVVDGETLATDVPATYLLWLEKRLTDIKTFVAKLPVLDLAERWHQDEATGLWASEPVATVRTRKIPKPVVKWEPPGADWNQPAQVDMYTEDVPVGRWTTQKFSGALPAQARTEMQQRVTKLIEAVKYARERANDTPAVDVKVGQALLGYVFG